MLIKYEEELYTFSISRGVPEDKYAKYYLTQANKLKKSFLVEN